MSKPILVLPKRIVVAPKGKRRGASPATAKALTALDFGRERFRFYLLRDARDLVDLNIDPFVEQCNWARETAIKTGNLNFRRPLTGMQANTIAQGDRIRCNVDLHSRGQWRRLWEMEVDTPDHQIVSGQMALALKSVSAKELESKMAWKFKNKTARQITIAVAKRLGMKIGLLPSTSYRLPKLVKKSMSGPDVLEEAWKQERTHSGRRFDIDMSRGLIDIVEQREPTYMLMIAGTILDATVKQTAAKATAVIVTSTRTVGGKTKKMKVTVIDAARERRFGHIEKTINKPKLQTIAKMRAYGRQWLARAREAKPTEDITFSHPGLAFLDKGDAINLQLVDAGLDQVAFVKKTEHALSAGSYVMNVTVGFNDPWVDVRKERVKKLKAIAADKRKRAAAKAKAKVLKAKKAARRS